MPDHQATPDLPPRLFASDAAIVRVGEGLLDRSLPRDDWTHEAHLAACLWLVTERPDFDPERDLPDTIRAFNAAKGGVNDDTQGYHETLTQLYIRGVRAFVARSADTTLVDRVNALLASDTGHRDWPLRFYSRERLFSVTARRGWVAPDRNEVPG
ncbi:hypothetical protein [Novosphingobium lentum]|uniref:hypothetical protein n=1 Tax=Novosphingobium lentum TaxID=145287 RepID=UPI0008351CD2|nr:hypothetical protein [Novosphingobium lentum]